MSLVGIYALRVSLCTRFVKGDQLGSSSSIFLLNFIMKRKMPSIRVVQLLYTIVYILLYFYTCKTNFVFFLFIDSSLMLCSNSALTGGQILSGGGQWRGRQSLDRDHPPPSGSESCCMDGRDDRASLPLHSFTWGVCPVVQLR